MAWSSSSASAHAGGLATVSPAVIDATLNAAANALRGGQTDAAVASVRKLAPELVSSPERCDLAGLVLLGAQRADEALAWFDRARLLQPKYWQAQAHAGSVLLSQGRHNEALTALDAAVAQGFVNAATHYHRGVVLRALGRKDEAIAALDQALRIEPGYPEALRVGGLILSEAGRYDQALAFFQAALAGNPQFFEARLDFGNLLRRLERYDDAIAVFTEGLRLFPGNPDLLNNRGVIFIDIGEFGAAAGDFMAAISAKPDQPEAYFNGGTVLLRAADPQAALASFDQAIALRPIYPNAHVGRGVALKELSRFDEARTAFDTAIAQDPTSAHAKNNKGALDLLRGDFERGLAGYEYRWMAGQTPKFKLEFPIPEWDGAVRAGEKVIVFDEQGIGDTIQFSRYLPMLAADGLDVTFFCRKPAQRLMKSLPGHIRCLDTFGPEERFDRQIALSSLPFARETRLSSVPVNVPYLAAEPELVAKWAARLAESGAMQDLKVGLCWAGNPNVRADPRRSIPLATFAPLMRMQGVRVVSIQKHHGLDEIAGLPQDARLETYDDFDNGPDAFIDSAALMQNLDLIVSCDTSVAHLAGALARPIFVLLKKIPDWRWMLEREDSPWYPTMRLFRQAERGDWDEVMARIVVALDCARKTKTA
ncbi:MAG TPA: tetratricopeptide repeat protein [Methylovirgula sp.]|nr:tetratricopeptide repeat protein [Methylovirgula sp.]